MHLRHKPAWGEVAESACVQFKFFIILFFHNISSSLPFGDFFSFFHIFRPCNFLFFSFGVFFIISSFLQIFFISSFSHCFFLAPSSSVYFLLFHRILPLPYVLILTLLPPLPYPLSISSSPPPLFPTSTSSSSTFLFFFLLRNTENSLITGRPAQDEVLL